MSFKGAHVLVVDDEPDIRELVCEILEDEEYEVSVAEDAAAAREGLRRRRPDLVLLDVWLPDTDGVELLREWAEEGGLPCPVIMIAGHGTVETAVEATRLGAYDFIEKPLSLDKLLLAVSHALEADRLARENRGLKHQALLQPDEPVGSSEMMETLRGQARRLAEHDSWILMSGESGGGKQTFARYIHGLSERRDGPFVDVGAGAMSARERTAVALFGSETDDRVGYGLLEQANGGTLFLGEVADMDMQTQTQLLSALEGQSFLRVGGSEPVKVDVRVVAATHRDLAEEVREGRFREDLFYHLNVVPLSIPPLREHPEDIPELLEYFVREFVTGEGLTERRFSSDSTRVLSGYRWPGNIRELKNLVQRLLILGSEPVVERDEVEQALGIVQAEPAPEAGVDLGLPLREAREAFERRYLEAQLQSCEGGMTELAQRTGMERTNLYRKLKSLGLDPKRAKATDSAEKR